MREERWRTEGGKEKRGRAKEGATQKNLINQRRFPVRTPAVSVGCPTTPNW